MDLVWLYGPAERQRTGELRYSLRSVDAHWRGYARAVVAGWAPHWFDGPVIEVPPVAQENPGRKHWQTTANLLAACEQLTQPFVLMNDDFFLLEDMSEVPALHAGPFLASRYQARESTYGEAHRRTAALLAGELAVKAPLDYELHVPMVVDPLVMAPILREYGRHGPICKRTLYGNLAGVGGRPTKDVKIYSVHALVPGGPFASTSAAAWCGRAGDWLRRLFPEPSPWERDC